MKQRVSEERKREILLDIARGLRYLHSQEPPVLHLDIKPANILMTLEGTAKLGDFGEAHVIQSSATLRKRQTMSSSRGTSSLFGVGTLDYMAPEMHAADEEKTPKVDMFSFGVLVAELGSEQPPNPGPDRARVAGRLQLVEERQRRAEDLAAVSSELLRQLASHLIDDHPLSRWNAQQVLDFLKSK